MHGEAATAPFRSLGTVIADVFAANPYAGWRRALDPLFSGVSQPFTLGIPSAPPTTRRCAC